MWTAAVLFSWGRQLTMQRRRGGSMQQVTRVLVLAVGVSVLTLWSLAGMAPVQPPGRVDGANEPASTVAETLDVAEEQLVEEVEPEQLVEEVEVEGEEDEEVELELELEEELELELEEEKKPEPSKVPGLFHVMDGMTCHYVPGRPDRYCERIDFNVNATQFLCEADTEILESGPRCIGGLKPPNRPPVFTGKVCTVIGSSMVVMKRNYTDVICDSDVIVYAGSANDYELSCGDGRPEPEAVAVYSSEHYKKKQYKQSTMERIAKRKQLRVSGQCAKLTPDTMLPMTPWFWGAVTFRPVRHMVLGTGFSALAEALGGCDRIKVIGFFPSDTAPDGLRIGYSNYASSVRLNQIKRYQHMMAMANCGMIEWIV